jgi:hypothetical protein
VKWHELDEMAAVSIAGMVAVQDLIHPPEKSVKKMMEDDGTGFSTSTFSTKKGFNLMKNLDSWNIWNAFSMDFLRVGHQLPVPVGSAAGWFEERGLAPVFPQLLGVRLI